MNKEINIKISIKGQKEKYTLKLSPKTTLEELRIFLMNEKVFNSKAEYISFYENEARILSGFLKEYTVEEILNDQNEIILGYYILIIRLVKHQGKKKKY